MRLIDADELKKLFPDYGEGSCTYNRTARMHIDNAPTVKLTETEIQAVLNKRGMTVVTNEYLIALHNNRPTGEWKETEEPFGWSDLTCCECSNCKQSWALGELSIEEVKEDFKFCPNCGAKMKGGAEE